MVTCCPPRGHVQFLPGCVPFSSMEKRQAEGQLLGQRLMAQRQVWDRGSPTELPSRTVTRRMGRGRGSCWRSLQRPISSPAPLCLACSLLGQGQEGPPGWGRRHGGQETCLVLNLVVVRVAVGPTLRVSPSALLLGRWDLCPHRDSARAVRTASPTLQPLFLGVLGLPGDHHRGCRQPPGHSP